MEELYARIIKTLTTGGSLEQGESEALMCSLMEGTLSHARVAAILTAYNFKQVSAAEFTGFASAMRSKATALNFSGRLMDTCGTGGSGLETVNTSTMTAFVLACFDIPIAKHGNRASSGKCGSMDLLEKIGVNIELSPTESILALETCGLAFLFAPRYHQAVRHVVPVRKDLGFRTIFNFLGPICNPALTRIQLLGVSDAAMGPVMLETLRNLGSERVLIVRGEDGLDEISLCGPSQIWELIEGKVRAYRFDPSSIGLPTVPFSSIAGGDADRNTALFQEILSGQSSEPYRQHLAVNAGAGLFVAGHAATIEDGYNKADACILSGAPFQKLEEYRDFTNRIRENA
jgi:anthranilate phosphoribosyltransferase